MNRKQMLLGLIVALGFGLVLSANALSGSGQIPITTKSTIALNEVATGVELLERLRFREAIPHFEKAIAEDKDCAIAYYYLAASTTSNRIAIENLNKAVALVDKVSAGERLQILALQAGFNGNTNKEEELIRQAVSQYPDDVRVRTILAAVLRGTQKNEEGIREAKRVLEIDPRYALAQNILGYLQSAVGNYAEAEKAFKAYTNLIPDEPNPYDSYGELLLKEGKFDESITMYRKALSLDPKFYSAVIGLATNFALKGMPGDGMERLQTMFDGTTDVSVRRQALTGMVNVLLLEGSFDKALEQLKRRHQLDIREKDNLSIAQDLNELGWVRLVQSGVNTSRGTFLKSRTKEPARVQEAAANFDDAAAVIQNSDLPKDIKDAAEWQRIRLQAEVALHNNDTATAKLKTEEFKARISAKNDPVLTKQAHFASGLIALAEGRYQDAIAELNMGELQYPHTLLRLAEAYNGVGDAAKAKELREKVLHFNDTSFDFAANRILAAE